MSFIFLFDCKTFIWSMTFVDYLLMIINNKINENQIFNSLINVHSNYDLTFINYDSLLFWRHFHLYNKQMSLCIISIFLNHVIYIALKISTNWHILQTSLSEQRINGAMVKVSHCKHPGCGFEPRMVFVGFVSFSVHPSAIHHRSDLYQD